MPEPNQIGDAPVHQGDRLSEDAAPAIRPAGRVGLVPGRVGRQYLADGIRTGRDTGESVVVPLYIKGYTAGYRRGDDRAASVPELDAPAREIGEILGRIIHENLAQDPRGPCGPGVDATRRRRDRTARRVHGCAEWSVGTLVEIVRDAIVISVRGWGPGCA